MKFWDSSAMIPLLFPEEKTEQMLALLRADAAMLVWCLTPLECYSALYRKNREQRLKDADVQGFKKRLVELEQNWTEVTLSSRVRKKAERLLAVHPLRAADSLQLSSAIALSEENLNFEFVCLDHRLSKAAALEGLTVLPI